MYRNVFSTEANTRRRPTGFTLIELLVVIGIVALLMGILMPALSGARAAALRVVCRSNLHGLAVAFQMYLDEYADILPPACQLRSLEDPNAADYKAPITEFLMAYVSKPEIFKCPADSAKNYYACEGTSYEYNARIGGQHVEANFLAESYGQANVHVMYDYDCFHGQAGKPGAKNYLYADGHIGDLTRQ